MYIIYTFDSSVWLTVLILFVQILKVLNLKNPADTLVSVENMHLYVTLDKSVW